MRTPPLLPLCALPLLAAAAGCSLDRTYKTQATPQRPTFSFDTSTTAPGTVELEAGLDIDPSDRFFTPTRTKYGVDERTELFLDFDPYVRVERDDGSVSGVGDIQPGIRRRLLDQDGSAPSAGYLVAARIPTGSPDKDIGSGSIDLNVAGIVNWDDEAWNLNGFYQLSLLGESESSGVDFAHLLSLTGTVPLQQRVDTYGELAFNYIPERDLEQLFAVGGLFYYYRPGLAFDAGVRVGLTDDAPEFAFLVGTTINFGRQKWRIRP